MLPRTKTSDFLHYLASINQSEQDKVRIPALKDLSKELGTNIARLREQLEVARALGLVDVSPRTGIHRRGYKFFPAVQQSLAYAIELDIKYFDHYSELRTHLEAAFWFEAVTRLTPDDHLELRRLSECAWEKLQGPQIQIPHQEHRQLHLLVYKRLENPFVLGILEAYWDAYEAVGLNLYAGYDYLQEVWQYHQEMVDCICRGDFEAGYRSLVEHQDLLYHHPGHSILAGNGLHRNDTPKTIDDH